MNRRVPKLIIKPDSGSSRASTLIFDGTKPTTRKKRQQVSSLALDAQESLISTNTSQPPSPRKKLYRRRSKSYQELNKAKYPTSSSSDYGASPRYETRYSPRKTTVSQRTGKLQTSKSTPSLSGSNSIRKEAPTDVSKTGTPFLIRESKLSSLKPNDYDRVNNSDSSSRISFRVGQPLTKLMTSSVRIFDGTKPMRKRSTILMSDSSENENMAPSSMPPPLTKATSVGGIKEYLKEYTRKRFKANLPEGMVSNPMLAELREKPGQIGDAARKRSESAVTAMRRQRKLINANRITLPLLKHKRASFQGLGNFERSESDVSSGDITDSIRGGSDSVPARRKRKATSSKATPNQNNLQT
uniref:uncharacterized protein LOC113474956 n=1 Tax=Ciona intestinalis TaxID=7719 RepID=UPI000EF4CB5A|nr:uncharacterized protein LOC113474956 [Ciona intestinalis]|eukprot:XP_026693918.1 uncharacterized protein LOC113474956 [Ciona intestinalis]